MRHALKLTSGLMVIAAGLALAPCRIGEGRSELVYPGATWATRRPAEVDMDAARLDAFRDYVGGRGCVVRHGYMVYSWGDQGKRQEVASAGKPVIVHLLFNAVEQGQLDGLDARVSAFEPRLNDLNPGLGCKDGEITWRHLATQTSCYGVEEQPGEAFDYNDYNISLFFDTLLRKVYGTGHDRVDEEVLHPQLTDLLQCQDSPTFMAFGTGERPGRFGISVRDFARFGLLYLRGGNWRGEQLISAEHARLAGTDPLPNSIPRTRGRDAEMIPGQASYGGGKNQTDHLGSYSYTWWTNGVDRDGRRHWPEAPADTYGAFGHWGPRALVVIPSLDLVVSWNDARVKGREMENEALRLLRAAVVQADPLLGQVVVAPKRPQWLARKGMGPFFMCGPGDPEGFLYRGKQNPDGTRDGDQMQLVEKLSSAGANCIYLMAVRSHGGDGDRTHNPFADNEPAKGINRKVLEQWESWFSKMDENGVVIYFFFYDDGARIWDTGDKVGQAEADFICTLVDRFEYHANLIWCIAEEYQEAYTPQRVSSIAAVIRRADDYHHVIAVHKLPGLDFSEFADDPNIDQFAIQYNVDSADELHRGMVTAWKKAAGRYNLNMSEASNFGAGAQARRKIWACAMGGAYVMILGMDIANTAPSDLEDCARLVRFMESTDFYDMAPHDQLRYGGTQYVLARPGRSYIAYASALARDMGLRALSPGAYTFLWFDCVTGRIVVQPRIEVPAGDHTWPKPAAIGDELAVFIQRAP